jgi:3-oxochol-4-en-24-oyl-CoA dehydrogenase
VSLAITPDQRTLEKVARAFLTDYHAVHAARATLETDEDVPPSFWKNLCDLGWLGVHIPAELGGAGFGLPELAILASELGRSIAPGPFLPTVVASATLLEHRLELSADALITELADGSRVAAVGLRDTLTASDQGTVSGDAGLVPGAGYADVLLLPVQEDLILVDATSSSLELRFGAQVDSTRRSPRVLLSDASVLLTIRGGRRTSQRIARILVAAEAAGAALACTEAARDYALVRTQFGRAIATFQAVKHHCADMAIDSDAAAALAWDAARSEAAEGQQDIAAAAAVAGATSAFARCARRNIQIHGGIGFTWEHDAHLYLRRSVALTALFPEAAAHADVVNLIHTGVTRQRGIDLPPEAETHRAAATAALKKITDTPADQQRAELVASGYLVPHWPTPWGRSADPIEQIVIDEEFDAFPRPHLGIGGWVLLTLAQEGTEDQQQRWISAGLRGDTRWCQLFSEPGAGSDAAAVATKGVRVAGGWRVTGQKVWTTNAQYCDFGLATVRTDRDATKHRGVTAMVIDLHAPGVDVRPLRELTGDTLFNEVFLEDVFVPDADVVGKVGEGWTVARATLRNERVSIGGTSIGEVGSAMDLAMSNDTEDPGEIRAIGELVVEHLAIQALNLRHAVRAVTQSGLASDGAVTKLLTAEHSQRITEARLRFAGDSAVDAASDPAVRSFLFARCLTIAGGTSEILRNQIAERVLGLPRDPLIK